MKQNCKLSTFVQTLTFVKPRNVFNTFTLVFTEKNNEQIKFKIIAKFANNKY